MNIIVASFKDVTNILHIVQTTINKVYPKYYPEYVVKFFLDHHSVENISKAISEEYILVIENDGKIIGTGSLLRNEIKRMFVLPEYQGLGYGSLLLEQLEHQALNEGHTTVILASSLSAFSLYLKKGYAPIEYKKIITSEKQVLCYYQMSKTLNLSHNISVDSKMECREMLITEIQEVEKLHNLLAYFVQKETEDDYFDFDELNEVSLKHHLEGFINNPSRKIYITKENGVIVGFISCEIINCFLPISSIKKVGHISGAYVLPEFRRKGIMKKMEMLAIDFFRSNDLKFVELDFLTKNIIAEKTWKSLGYITFREQMRKTI